MRGFSIIVAFDEKMGIGKGNALPWRLSLDMKHFRDVTMALKSPRTQNVVIMGRKTWESLPGQFKPLPGRINVVITSQKDYFLPSGVRSFSSFDEAVLFFGGTKEEGIGDIFVIGGAKIYAQAVVHPLCQRIYATCVSGDHSCDVTFPPIPAAFFCLEKTSAFQENEKSFFFSTYQKQ